uniref:Uncharacterized protein n=1 Tax=Arundo donax TaxID=35708 RepID=A0A0A9BCM3_ARUDO
MIRLRVGFLLSYGIVDFQIAMLLHIEHCHS